MDTYTEARTLQMIGNVYLNRHGVKVRVQRVVETPEGGGIMAVVSLVGRSNWKGAYREAIVPIEALTAVSS